MNKDAGRGKLLFVTLRLESGERLPFGVDTGSPITIFDKSLEPKLGKRLDTTTLWNFGVKSEGGIYATPALYLGSTPLMMTGNNIYTHDFKEDSHKAGRTMMGLLGMDCLEHYCIQLDFEAGKMRFLDPDHVNIVKLGKAFPLTFSSEDQPESDLIRPFIHHGSLIGGEGTNLLIDTGADMDGGMKPQFFQTEIRQQKDVVTDEGLARFPEGVLDGVTYTNLTVGTWPDDFQGPNLMGLKFLARHLVTLDFPRRTMYLKQTSIGPLGDADVNAIMKAEAKSTIKALKQLKKRGQLPGWSKNDELVKTATFHFHYPASLTLDLLKKGDSSTYHYEFTRASEDFPWKLQKAWRTDQSDHTVEEYPVPQAVGCFTPEALPAGVK